MRIKAALIITPPFSHIFHLNNETNGKNFLYLLAQCSSCSKYMANK